MNLNDKILTIRGSLDKSLNNLIYLFNKSENNKDKDEIKEIIEIHISYIIFLKELEINKKSKGITKEFIIQQFQNILESCNLVEDIYQEKIDN